MPGHLAFLGESMIGSTDQAGPSAGQKVSGGRFMIGIECPAELTGNCYLEASNDHPSSTWKRVQAYGIDIVLAPNRFVIVDGVPARWYRPVSDAQELDDRLFLFWSILDI